MQVNDYATLLARPARPKIVTAFRKFYSFALKSHAWARAHTHTRTTAVINLLSLFTNCVITRDKKQKMPTEGNPQSALKPLDYLAAEGKGVKRGTFAEKPAGDEGEDQKGIETLSPEDDNDDEAGGEREEKNLATRLQLFSANPTNEIDGTLYFLTDWFKTFTTHTPGGSVRYLKQMVYAQLVARFKNAKETAAVVNYVYRINDKTLPLVEEATFSHFKTLSQRLVDVKEKRADTILVFSTADLACLFSLRASVKESIKKVRAPESSVVVVGGGDNDDDDDDDKGEATKKKPTAPKLRKTAEKSRPEWEKRERIVDRMQENAKRELRKVMAVPSTPLASMPFLYAGNPLVEAVQHMRGQVRHRQRAPESARAVAIFYDFETNKIGVVDAEDCNVPSARQLDHAFAALLTHPERVILLDLRAEYKEHRDWPN